MIRYLSFALFAALTLSFTVGCGGGSATSPQQKAKVEDDHHDHEGNEIDATLPDGTKCHAILSAHMHDGVKELVLEFESFEEEGKAITLSEATKITGEVTREGDDTKHKLEFQPEEAEGGKASVFAAEAPWMEKADKLSVTITIGDSEKKLVWVDFVPEKFMHDHDE